jgi:hypothetical protein
MHRRGGQYHIGTRNLGGYIPKVDRDATRLQWRPSATLIGIAATDTIATVEQNMRDGTHAGATNPDNMVVH